MNKFEKQLEKWNNGVLRGAQAKLAKALQVSTATTALWATGKRRPSKGYVAQMARLFGLDIYQVVKLFEMPVSVTYPNPASVVPALRDRESAAYQVHPAEYEEESTSAGNTVTLPFLDTVPVSYPQISDETIVEYWNIPRRYAQGAKYILRSRDLALKDASADTDLCFIKPCTDPDNGQAVLLTDEQGHICVCRANRKQNSLSYQTLSGKQAKNMHAYKVLGVILRRIKPF